MNIIITGASGSGKSSVIKYLKEKYNLPLSISFTTREKRIGEENNVDYNFITKQEFEKMIENEELEEYTFFNDNYYGTPKIKDKDYLFDLEYEGVLHFKNSKDNCLFIFIDVEKSELKNRLKKRGATDEDIKNRMVKFLKFKELKNTIDFDLCVDNNKSLENTLKIIEDFLKNKSII